DPDIRGARTPPQCLLQRSRPLAAAGFRLTRHRGSPTRPPPDAGCLRVLQPACTRLAPCIYFHPLMRKSCGARFSPCELRTADGELVRGAAYICAPVPPLISFEEAL